MQFFLFGMWSVLYAYTPELYPTRARATGAGLRLRDRPRRLADRPLPDRRHPARLRATVGCSRSAPARSCSPRPASPSSARRPREGPSRPSRAEGAGRVNGSGHHAAGICGYDRAAASRFRWRGDAEARIRRVRHPPGQHWLRPIKGARLYGRPPSQPSSWLWEKKPAVEVRRPGSVKDQCSRHSGSLQFT